MSLISEDQSATWWLVGYPSFTRLGESCPRFRPEPPNRHPELVGRQMVIEAGAEEFGLSDQYLANLEREGNPRGASARSKSSRTATWQRAAAGRTEIRAGAIRREAHRKLLEVCRSRSAAGDPRGRGVRRVQIHERARRAPSSCARKTFSESPIARPSRRKLIARFCHISLARSPAFSDILWRCTLAWLCTESAITHRGNCLPTLLRRSRMTIASPNGASSTGRKSLVWLKASRYP